MTTPILLLRLTTPDRSQRPVPGLPSPLACAPPPSPAPPLTADVGEVRVHLSDRGYRETPPRPPAGPLAGRRAPGLPSPLAAAPLPAPARLDVDVSSSTSLEAAAAEHRYWAPRVLPGADFGARLLSGGELTSGQPQIGDLRVANEDGALDPDLRRDWQGQAARLWLQRGNVRTDYAAGRVRAVAWDRDAWRIQIGAPVGLDARIERPVFDGSGGTGGDPVFAGRPRPLMYGACENVEAHLIAAADLLYQINAGRLVAVSAVRDRGLALTAAAPADYPSAGALLAASTGIGGSGAAIEAGEYATCLAEGLVRVAAQPAGVLTGDARSPMPQGRVVPSTSHVVQAILAAHAPDVPVDATLAADLHAAVPSEMGIVVTESVSVLALVRRLLAPIGAWARVSAAGTLEMRLLSPAAAGASLGESEIVSIERIEVSPPAWRRRVAFRPIWRALGAAEIAGAVDEGTRALLGTPRRYVAATSDDVRRRVPDARDVEIDGFLATAHATAERAAAVQSVLGAVSRAWRVDVLGRVGELGIGDSVTVSYPRWGVDAVPMLVIGIDEAPSAGRTVLELLED